jgi:ParB/RepB/Spo0J family partition protein
MCIDIDINLIDTDVYLYNEAQIYNLMGSIKEVGLINPLIVKKNKDRYSLVSGYQRLYALKNLGYHFVPVIVKEMDAIRSKLLSIDENLIRKELSPLEKADYIAERERIFNILYPGRKDFTKDLAKKTNSTQRTIQQDLQIAKNIRPELKERLKSARKSDLVEISRLDYENQGSLLDYMGKNNGNGANKIVIEKKTAKKNTGGLKLKTKKGREILVRVYFDLKINTEGKTNKQIKEEIETKAKLALENSELDVNTDESKAVVESIMPLDKGLMHREYIEIWDNKYKEHNNGEKYLYINKGDFKDIKKLMKITDGDKDLFENMIDTAFETDDFYFNKDGMTIHKLTRYSNEIMNKIKGINHKKNNSRWCIGAFETDIESNLKIPNRE